MVVAVFVRCFGLRLCNVVKKKCKADIVLIRCNCNGFYNMSVNIINMPFADLSAIESRHKFGNNHADYILILKQNLLAIFTHKKFDKFNINSFNSNIFQQFFIVVHGS